MTSGFFINVPEYNGAGIYQITNLKNNRKYIGSSAHIKARIMQHSYSFKTRQCSEKFISDLEDDAKFSVEILKIFSSEENLSTMREFENKCIVQANSIKAGYNTRFVDYIEPERGARKIGLSDKKHFKNSVLRFSPEKYEEIKAAATAADESINGYIKKAVDQRMERDNA